jgi:hypothetical protein
MLIHWLDADIVPDTKGDPEIAFNEALPVAGTPGEDYVLSRGIPISVAIEADVRFSHQFNGRPAVLAAMRNVSGELLAVHGRYLHEGRRQTKMLTVGRSGGIVSVMGGIQRDPMVIVEGLFDALSLAACGVPSIATIGRWPHGLPAWATGRTVILAFDGNKPGDEAARADMLK